MADQAIFQPADVIRARSLGGHTAEDPGDRPCRARRAGLRRAVRGRVNHPAEHWPTRRASRSRAVGESPTTRSDSGATPRSSAALRRLRGPVDGWLLLYHCERGRREAGRRWHGPSSGPCWRSYAAQTPNQPTTAGRHRRWRGSLAQGFHFKLKGELATITSNVDPLPRGQRRVPAAFRARLVGAREPLAYTMAEQPGHTGQDVSAADDEEAAAMALPLIPPSAGIQGCGDVRTGAGGQPGAG